MTWVSEFVVCAGWAGYVMAGFDLLWWVVVAKVGRAVGSRDYAFVAKYFKMEKMGVPTAPGNQR